VLAKTSAFSVFRLLLMPLLSLIDIRDADRPGQSSLPLHRQKSPVKWSARSRDPPPLAMPNRVTAMNDAALTSLDDPGHLLIPAAVGSRHRSDNECPLRLG